MVPGIPHYLIQDDEYEGYHIPAGTTMHPLEWCEPMLFTQRTRCYTANLQPTGRSPAIQSSTPTPKSLTLSAGSSPNTRPTRSP